MAERPNQMLPSSDRKEMEGKDKPDDLVEKTETETKKEQKRRPNLANHKDDLDIIVKEERNTGKVRCSIW